MKKVCIRSENISKQYGDQTALLEIDLEIQNGETVVILGPNGSGKSTLLKILTGEIQPDRGTVMMDQQPLSQFSPRERARRIACLQQEPLPDLPFRVEEIVRMGRFPHQKHRLWYHSEKDDQVVEKVMQQLHLSAKRKQLLMALSGGERQRVSLAQALVQEPRVLFLDEPTTFLDLSYQYSILDLITAWKKEQGTSLVMVLHDLNLAAQYADRILLLQKGRMVATGTPLEVLVPENIEEVFQVSPICIQRPDVFDGSRFLFTNLDRRAKQDEDHHV